MSSTIQSICIARETSSEKDTPHVLPILHLMELFELNPELTAVAVLLAANFTVVGCKINLKQSGSSSPLLAIRYWYRYKIIDSPLVHGALVKQCCRFCAMLIVSTSSCCSSTAVAHLQHADITMHLHASLVFCATSRSPPGRVNDGEPPANESKTGPDDSRCKEAIQVHRHAVADKHWQAWMDCCAGAAPQAACGGTYHSQMLLLPYNAT